MQIYAVFMSLLIIFLSTPSSVVLLFIFEITLNEALTIPSLKMPQIVAIQLYFVVMCLVQ